jgi:methionyl-tRNA formyltransferase
VELLDRVLPDPVFTPQPADGVTYAEKITPEDRVLHWTDAPTTSLNRIRALSPHIGARGTAAGRPVIVWRARLATGDAKLVEGGLELLEVQPEGKGRMSGAAFLNGLR